MKTAYTDLYNIAHFYYNTLLCMESLGNAMKKRNYRKINKKNPNTTRKIITTRMFLQNKSNNK